MAQTAHYNNHYYLILLLSGLLWTTPAAADSSFDAWRDPRRRSGTCPRWCYTIFIAQTAILYGYAAYAKLQPDWLAARPLSLWLEVFARNRPFGTAVRIASTAAFATYFVVQMALPLRHHLYPGNVDWHEEGYTMSWRMMLRAKAGRARFIVREPSTGAVWQVDPAATLTRHQAAKLPGRPDMIWRFAQELKSDYGALGFHDVEVFGDVRVRLSGRPGAPLVDPYVDLAAARWRFIGFNDWITPLPRP